MLDERKDRYRQIYPVANFLLNRKFDIHVEGTEHIPDQPAIYTPNHIRFEDSLLVAKAFTDATGNLMRFGAKREYFDGLGINNDGKNGKLLKWVMESTHQIPVDREGKDPRAFFKLQAEVADRTNHGNSVTFHPEGTRSEDGRLHKFKDGAARIAIALSLPIVPVGLVYDVQSNRRKIDATVSFGEPIMPEEYTRLPYSAFPAKLKAQHFIQVAEDRVADLTDMEQSGIFAILKKHRHHPPHGQK